MKFYLIVLLLLASNASFYSQNKIQMIKNHLDAKEMDKAKKLIEEVISTKKYLSKPQPWFYRILVYQDYITTNKTPNTGGQYLEKMLESYQTLKQIDKKRKYINSARSIMDSTRIVIKNLGVQLMNKYNYNEALERFSSSIKVSEKLGIIDSSAIHMVGMMANSARQYEEAIRWFKKSDSLGYQPIETCNFLYESYSKVGNLEKATGSLDKCIQQNPNNVTLLELRMNHALSNMKWTSAKKDLTKLINLDPRNKLYHFNMSIINASIENLDAEESSLKNALQIDPNYTDANYNLGAHYYNRAVQYNKDVNSSSDDLMKKNLKEKSRNYFLKAIPFFEKVRQSSPEDQSTLSSLQQIYNLTGQKEKAEELEKILNTFR